MVGKIFLIAENMGIKIILRSLGSTPTAQHLRMSSHDHTGVQSEKPENLKINKTAAENSAVM